MGNELSINPDKNEIDLETTLLEKGSPLIKGILGCAPYIGSVLSELVGAAIPNQKIERVIIFAQVLDQKLRYMEKDVREAKMKTAEFADLLEDAVVQASRATTDERLEYIASILQNSLTDEEIDHIGQKKLLTILNELNDAEIIFLRANSLGPTKHEVFYKQHENLLKPNPVDGASSWSDNFKEALRESYQKNRVN